MKQKFIAVLLSLAMVCIFLTGCDGSEAPASPSESHASGADSSASDTVSKPEAPAASSSTSAPSSSENSASSSTSAPSSSENSASSTTESDKPLVIGNNSSYYIQSGDYYYCYYLVELTNPNTTKAVRYAELNTTIKNKDGKVLRSSSEYLPTIAANDTIYYTGYVMVQSEEPDFAHYTVEYSTSSFVNQRAVKVARSSELKVSNTYWQESSSSFNRFTGEVTNTSKYDLSSVKVMVLYKVDGKIYGGDSTSVVNLPAGATKSFEILAHKLPVDTYEYMIVAVQK